MKAVLAEKHFLSLDNLFGLYIIKAIHLPLKALHLQFKANHPLKANELFLKTNSSFLQERLSQYSLA